MNTGRSPSLIRAKRSLETIGGLLEKNSEEKSRRHSLGVSAHTLSRSPSPIRFKSYQGQEKISAEVSPCLLIIHVIKA